MLSLKDRIVGKRLPYRLLMGKRDSSEKRVRTPYAECYQGEAGL